MKSLVVVCLLALVCSVQGSRKHSDEKSGRSCSFIDSGGSFYDLSKLRNPAEAAYSFETDTESIYFNVCGALANVIDSRCAHSEAAVCAIVNGTAVNAGRATSMAFTELEDGQGVVLTYSNGQMCNGSAGTRRSVLNFKCPTGVSNVGLGISSFEQRDDCTMVLNLTSVYACPASPVDADMLIWLPIMLWLSICACITMCCACGWLCLRRCRARREVKERMDRILSYRAPYTPLPVNESVHAAVPEHVVDVETPPPYAGHQQYYSNAVVYPASFEPAPQTYTMYPATYPTYPTYPSFSPAPVAPHQSAFEPVRAPATYGAPSSATSDEQLARALQAQYDSEVRRV